MTRILVTGAGRGIGFELARQALDKGWEVVGSVRTKDAAKSLKERLPQITVLEFDVTDGKAIKQAARTLDGPVDILVNNAGVYGPRDFPIAEIDCDALQELYEINVISPVRVVQAFLKNVRASDSPRIVNISSRLGLTWVSAAGKTAYCSSKAALNRITQGMSEEFAGDGITCIAMHPGWVRTDMGGDAADEAPEESAAGILEVIGSAGFKDNGSFINFDGERWNW